MIDPVGQAVDQAYAAGYEDGQRDALAARLAAVEALADEWERWAHNRSTPRIDAFRDAAESLRAAVVADPADTTR